MPRPMPDVSLPPRIGFNATLLSLTPDFRAAGIHRYILALLEALAARSDVRLTAFVTEPRARQALPPAVAVWQVPAVARHRAARIAWEQLMLPGALRRSEVSLLHSAAYALPVACPIPAVVTIHDLSPFRMPETLPKVQSAYLRLATRHAVRRADALIAVSHFTARELVELLGADPARVHVVPNGLDPSCRVLPTAAVEAYRARAGLPERFILTLGTLQPRKNLGTLLEAYARFRQRQSHASMPESVPDRLTDRVPHLVVAGSSGWGRDDLAARIGALGLADCVHVLGFVPGEDLPALYNAALAFAYPSRYEGFGLPVIEAMACGTPTVVADASSLPEVAGDAALLVAPDDVAGWAEALGAVTENDTRRAEQTALGLARAARYSWARAAEETVAIYESVLARSKADVGARRPGLAHHPAILGGER